MVRKGETSSIKPVRSNANILYIDGQKIELENVIWSFVALEDRVIVCFTPRGYDADDPRKPRNIICVDRNGNEIWRIEPTRGNTFSTMHDREVRASYDGVFRLTPRSPVKCSVEPGVEFDIKIDTGAVSNPEFVK